MKLHFEWGQAQLCKHGEELCGDSIAVSRMEDTVTLALSDGLGSGVKANILSTLTTRIAMHLLQYDLPLSEVVKTISETLPVCQVRKMAYSTFAIAQFHENGQARIVEFDSPPVVLLRGRKLLPVIPTERVIENKTIQESIVDLELGDVLVFFSDGVLNAGIGGVYPLGWGWEQAAEFVRDKAHPELTAQDLADRMAEAANALYAQSPGDDVSVVVIKVRRKLTATVLTGPPTEPEDDQRLVTRFTEYGGRLIVCGGTTAKIVATRLGQPLDVDLGSGTRDVPAAARIQGIDLVTEGILTLTKASELLCAGATKHTVRFKRDGASALVRQLLEVDHVHFLVGQAMNPAHQNPDLPHHLELRLAVVREIAEELKSRGKEVSIESV